MPTYAVINENFRDEAIKHAYPFDENSRLEDADVYIGTDLVIDAVFSIKEPVSLPLNIRVVDGTVGPQQVRFTIADSKGNDIGSTVASYDVTTTQVVNAAGVLVGAMVFSPDGMARFIGRVAGSTFILLPDVASFLLDVCHVSRTPHLRYFRISGTAVYGDVTFVARHKCRFVRTSSGLRLDIVGDPPAASGLRPVLSVNKVHSQSIWLANHPKANLRISGDGGILKFSQASEDK